MSTASWLPIISGALGVVIGAAVQYYSARMLQRGGHFTELRSRAYVDFAKAIATIAVIGRDRAPEAAVALTDLTDAKTRIALYGSDSVLSALESFGRTNETLSEETANSALIALIAAMREDATGQRCRAETKVALAAILLKK